jgi:mono/diheme cytochrome c family protein
MNKSRVALVYITLLGVAIVFAFGRTPLAADEGTEVSSSSCISCHTDLAKMDSYGASSGAAEGGIAG